MKTTLITTALFLIFSCSSFAQLTPGSYIVGGGLGFGFNQSPNEDFDAQILGLSVSLSAGKFTSEKYLVEGGLGYSFNSLKVRNDFNNSKQANHSFRIQFGLTRFFPITERLYINVRAGISPSFSQQNSEVSSSGTTTITRRNLAAASLSLSPGLSYFVNKRWMLFAQVGGLAYQVSKVSNSNQLGHSFGFNLSANSFNIGARYILGINKN